MDFFSKALKRFHGKGTVSAKGPSKPDYGLHTIVPKDAQAVDCVDIVAIHGLNGHYRSTWTDEDTDVNWLADIIPEIVPKARIMSFWYNSILQFSKSTSDISDFGDQLLEGLSAQRKNPVESERPIIFICHSLGGLVFKQAFIRAQESKSYIGLKNKFGGVMFFGTPHRGSQLASWASIIAKILKSASFGTTTNLQLAEDLEPQSRILDYISASFRNQSSNLRIISCYETLKMDFLNCVVVEKNSATLGISTETVISLERDHRTMCRFSDIDANQFGPIKARLEELVKHSRSTKENNPFNAMESFQKSNDDAHTKHIMKLLGASNYNAHKNRNPARVKGTCTWIFAHDRYKTWLQSPGPSLLWFSADPGCGKSVLASFLIDNMSRSSETSKTNVCYFFFKSDNIEQSSAVAGMKALLHQLYSQQRDLISTGLETLQGGNLEKLETLWKAFLVFTEHRDANSTICFLDGIDECDSGSRGHLLSLISKHFRQQEGQQNCHEKEAELVKGSSVYQRSNSMVKLFVTSRPENQIKNALQSLSGRSTEEPEAIPVKCAMIRLRGEDETDAISDDITKVVKAKINDLIHQGLPREILEEVEAQLIVRADRTFLWVSLILNLLEQKVEAGASRRELDELLRNRDIFNVYSELLASRLENPKAQKLLSIVLAAYHPLTTEEMSIALAITPVSITSEHVSRRAKLTLDEIEDDIVYPCENYIKSLCGQFIRIVHDKVYLIHETAREFLLTTRNYGFILPSMPIWSDETRALICQSSSQEMGAETGEDITQPSFTLIGSHLLLLNICVTYLYCLGWDTKDFEIGQPSPKTEKFGHYAYKAWCFHHYNVRDHVGTADASYYNTICQPLSPSFERWMNHVLQRDPFTTSIDDQELIVRIELLDIISQSKRIHNTVCHRVKCDKTEFPLKISIHIPSYPT
ncbi:hypothetical protein F5B20DRAFT_555609 [Whalleya microplaca]|nr:hypothetical protein F5B20DRAFT_555609 [Whalleya microplaca]